MLKRLFGRQKPPFLDTKNALFSIRGDEGAIRNVNYVIISSSIRLSPNRIETQYLFGEHFTLYRKRIDADQRFLIGT